MHDGRAPVVVAVVVLVAGMIAAFVIGTPSPSPRGEDAATAFVSAWERSRLATYFVQSDFIRTLADGQQLRSTTTVVQRPPDRLTIGLGSVAGRIDGKIVRCAATPVPSDSCVTGATAPPYEAEVEDELRALTDYVTGDRPLYRVVDFGGDAAQCFRLDLALALPSPPYGDHALFCFDRASGAPSLTEIHREEATDTTIARQIRTEVGPEDLVVPEDRGNVSGSSEGGG